MNQDNRDKLMANVRVMQIITLAMAMGVLMFGLTVLLVMRPEEADQEPFIAYLGFGLAIPAAIASFVVPRIITNSQSPTTETYQTGLIIGLALLEGAAFLNIMAYMIEGTIYSLGVAAVLLVLLLARFPTVVGVSDWIEQRTRRQRENEAFGK